MKNVRNILIKAVTFAVVIAYVIWPFDLCPGPVDDLIVAALSVAAQKKLTA